MKYFPAHCSLVPAGTHVAFLTDNANGRSYTIAKPQAHAFLLLFGCRTPEHHVEQLLMHELPNLNRDLARSLVSGWIHQGLLQPESVLGLSPETATTTAPGSPPAPQCSFCCCTAGRPAALRAWLHEHATFMSAQADMLQQVLIIEDSRNHVDIAQNRQAVTEFQRSSAQPVPVRIFDRTARKDFVRQLGQQLPTDTKEEVLSFAFLGELPMPTNHTSLGAARNTALLCGAAPLLNFCDDDIRARFYTLPGDDGVHDGASHSGGAVATSRPLLLSNPTSDVRFFPDAATLEAECTGLTDYPVYRRIAEAFNTFNPGTTAQPPALDLSAAGPELLALLQAPTPVSVHAVSTGYCGARPYAHPFRTFLFRHEHSEQLLEDRTAFERIRQNPLLIRHCTHTVLDGALSFSPGFSAIDARSPAIPFFPVGRRQDDTYRAMYRICFPEQLFVNLPVAAFHDPQYKCPFPEAEIESYPLDIGAWTHIITQRFAARLHHHTGAYRLQEMALSFLELSSLSSQDLRSFLLPLHQAHYKALVLHIQRELELYADPPWWVTERRHALSVLQREQSVGPHQTAEQLQEYLEIYRLWGELLMLWPEIVQASR